MLARNANHPDEAILDGVQEPTLIALANFGLTISDVGIIISSLAVVTVVGLIGSRNRDKTARDYFLAGQKLPWWLIGGALVATSVSSEQIVGTMGVAYLYGMGITNWEWWTLPTYTIVILFFIPVYLKTRIMTVPEYLSKRFGPSCGDIYSWIMLVAYVVIYMVTILYGGSVAFSQLTGSNYFLTLWVIVAVVALYTVKGGLTSVVWADAVQCIMLVGGGVILFLTALNKVPGGWPAMVRASPERFHLYHPANDPIAPFLGLVVLAVGLGPFYQGTSQVMIQRVLAARSTWDGIMGTIFAGFINFIRPMVTVFPGFIVYYWIYIMHVRHPLKNPDLAFPFLLRTLGPARGFRGIVLAGFIAAMMSAVSSLANSTSTIFTLDVYKRKFKPETDDRGLVMIGRIASLSALVFAALLSPIVGYLGGIFRYFQTSVTYLATPFISVILLGLLWKRTSYRGAMFGLVGGIVIQASVAFGLYALGLKLHWLYVGFIAQAITMMGIILVSLGETTVSDAPRAELYWRPHYLLQYDEGAVRPWYQSLKLWFGVYAVIWLYLYVRFW